MKKELIKRVFEISGYNLNYLVGELKRRNADVYGLKRASDKKLIITVDFKDCEKLFAICRNMCYNVREKGISGVFAPVYRLISNIGVAIGAVLFVAAAYYFDGIYFSHVYKGDAYVYAKPIEEILKKNGVKPWVRFSCFNTDKISDEIFVCDNTVSFVSVKKRGNKLIICVYRSKSEVLGVEYSDDDLISDYDGVILDTTVLSGTAKVRRGDEVKKGDVLVGAYYTVAEEMKSAPVIAEISIKTIYEFAYSSNGKDDIYKSRAYAVAAENLGEKKIFSHTETVEETNDGIIINVRIEYEEIIRAGAR